MNKDTTYKESSSGSHISYKAASYTMAHIREEC